MGRGHLLPATASGQPESQALLINSDGGGDAHDDLHGAGGMLKPGGPAAADLGTISGALGITFFAVWGYWMQVVLIEVAESYAPRIFSYEDLVERTLGKFGKLILALFMAVTTLLGNAAHMKTVVTLLHDLLEWYITGTYGKVEMDTTKELILYIGLLSVAFVFSTGNRIGTILYSTDWESYAADLPAIAFAFSGTFCLFPVYREIHDKSLPNMKKVIGRSTFICAAGYMIVSLFGIWTFGKDIDVNPTTGKPASNYLYVFPPDHYVVTLLCFGIVIVITLLYAVINFPFLASMEKLMDFLPGFKNLLQLFGFCGGWGISFLKKPFWYQMLLVLSALAVLVMAGGFTYSTFHPKNGNRTKLTDDFGPNF
eukprot:gene8648-11159_t